MKDFKPKQTYKLPPSVIKKDYQGAGRATIFILVDTDEVATIDYHTRDRLMRIMDNMMPPAKDAVKLGEDEKLRSIAYDAVLSCGQALLYTDFK